MEIWLSVSRDQGLGCTSSDLNYSADWSPHARISKSFCKLVLGHAHNVCLETLFLHLHLVLTGIQMANSKTLQVGRHSALWQLAEQWGCHREHFLMGKDVFIEKGIASAASH